MSLGYLHADTEPQARASDFPCAGLVNAVEPVEYERQVICGYADSCVLDPENGVWRFFQETDLDAASLWSVLYGVVDEVIDEL